MALRRKLLFVGLLWGLMSGAYQLTNTGTIGPLVWPFLVGQQIFYLLGVPAVPPTYFYTLGVIIWSLLFYAAGSLLDRLLSLTHTEHKKEKQRVRGY